MATAHCAGLMLVPFVLRLCVPEHGADVLVGAHGKMAETLARSGLATALAIAGLHTAAMMTAGLAMAWAVYRYLGLGFLRRTWFNLDLAWAGSLVLAGAAGVWMSL